MGPVEAAGDLTALHGTDLMLYAKNSAYWRDLLAAGWTATLVGGTPSTLYAFATGADPMEATRAAGAMLIPASSGTVELVLAAALVHVSVSFFWAAILVRILPRRHIMMWASAAAALIGLVDLRLIAPVFFPEVAGLPLAPQMADHLMWGASLGWVLARRSRTHVPRRQL
jgi:hypothetical protein